MTSWGKEETLKLIAIWADERVQAQLEGCHRNRDVFEQIAKLLGEEGYERTYEQCREKLKKLKADYRKIKDKQGKTGEGRKDWEFFDALDAVLGHKPATQPRVVVDTLADHTVEDDDESDLLAEGTSASLMESSDSSSLKENSSSSTSLLESSDSSSLKVKSSSSTATNKKRKRSKTDAFEQVLEGVVDKLVQAQSESEARLLEFEEKRMKMEERQKEREMELLQADKREQRNFQLAMMQMLAGSPVGTQGTSHSYPPPSSSATQFPPFSYYQPFENDN